MDTSLVSFLEHKQMSAMQSQDYKVSFLDNLKFNNLCVCKTFCVQSKPNYLCVGIHLKSITENTSSSVDTKLLVLL